MQILTLNTKDREYDGLLACYVAVPGVGMVDLVSGVHGARGGTADSQRYAEGGVLDAYFDGVGDQYAFGTTPIIDTGNPFTIVAEALLDSFVDAFPCLIGLARGVANKPLLLLYSNNVNYDNLALGIGGDSAVYATVPSGIAASGERHWLVWSYLGGGLTTTANHNVWINGAACVVGATPAFGTRTDQNSIGGDSASTDDWNGGIRQVRPYYRAWNADDAARFYASRGNALYTRNPRRYFFPIVGGGAVDLAVADATHGHTTDGIALTQDHILAIADAAHVHSTDGIALTQDHVLAVAEALHAHVADNVELTVEGELVVADAVHAHLADNLDLTQAHVLAIIEAAHAHFADNLTLTTGALVEELLGSSEPSRRAARRADFPMAEPFDLQAEEQEEEETAVILQSIAHVIHHGLR